MASVQPDVTLLTAHPVVFLLAALLAYLLAMVVRAAFEVGATIDHEQGPR